MDCARSYSVAHRAGLLPTELTGVWGWILLRSPHQGRGSPPAPAPTKQRPDWVHEDMDTEHCTPVDWCARSVLGSGRMMYHGFGGRGGLGRGGGFHDRWSGPVLCQWCPLPPVGGGQLGSVCAFGLGQGCSLLVRVACLPHCSPSQHPALVAWTSRPALTGSTFSPPHASHVGRGGGDEGKRSVETGTKVQGPAWLGVGWRGSAGGD